MSFYRSFAEPYEAVFPFRQPVYGFLRACAESGSASVLDIGCGPGHYCGRFVKDGSRAVGIDLDAAMIDAARARHPGAVFHPMDMTGVGSLEETFDLAFCIGNVASHVDRSGWRATIGGVSDRLRGGGTVVVQVVNWDYILDRGGYEFAPKSIDGGLVFHREYRDVGPEGVRFHTRLARGDDTLFEGEVALFPMRAEERFVLHETAGFETVGHYADFGRTPFDAGVDSGSISVFRKREA